MLFWYNIPIIPIGITTGAFAGSFFVMNDETLKQLADRLRLDVLLLQRIYKKFNPENEEELLKLINQVEAFRADGDDDTTAINKLSEQIDSKAAEDKAVGEKNNPVDEAIEPSPQTVVEDTPIPVPEQTYEDVKKDFAAEQPPVTPTENAPVIQPASQVDPSQPVAPVPVPPQPGQPPIQQPAATGAGGVNFYNKYKQGYRFNPNDGVNELGGQCAWFAQQITTLPDGSNWTIGNNLLDKKSQLSDHASKGNAFFKGQDVPKVGNSIVFGGGQYGHVGVIAEVLPDNKVRLTEANYNNDLRVRHDRIVSLEDPNIQGFVRTKPTQDFREEPPEEFKKGLEKQGVKTNELTPAEPELPQNVDPQDPIEQKEANKELEPINKQLETERVKVTPKLEDIPGVNDDVQAKILSQLPQNQREAAAKALPDIASALKEQGILNSKTLGYALATASHEASFVPKEEIMAQRGINSRNDYVANLQDNYSGGKQYRGRGYIQLTHDYNYDKYGKIIGEDLVNNPDRATDPKVAAKILAAYMKNSGVADSVNQDDLINARIKVQGRGATNAQFMPTTQAIAKMSQGIASAVGDNTDALFRTTNDQQTVPKTQQNMAKKQDIVPTEQPKNGILAAFTRATKPTDALKSYAENLVGSIDYGVSPDQKQQFTENIKTGNVIFSPAVRQADQVKQTMQQAFQDPVNQVKNAISNSASAAVKPLKNSFQQALTIQKKREVSPPASAPSRNNSTGQSAPQVAPRQAQAAAPVRAPTSRPAPVRAPVRAVPVRAPVKAPVRSVASRVSNAVKSVANSVKKIVRR